AHSLRGLETHACRQQRHPLHDPRRQPITRQAEHRVERKKAAAPVTRQQVLSAVAHFAVDRLQTPLGIGIAGTILTLAEEWPQLQALMSGAQKQPDQASAQDRYADEQLPFELPKRLIANLAK